ncbi:MAG: hypothetical protein V2I82_05020, partial [Halieaceae bacterium]|nr:hypothetical protein [Halieaceae bacterium]
MTRRDRTGHLAPYRHRSPAVLAVVALPVLLFLGACSSPRIQPLMPTPVLFSELGFSPLDHVPPEQRWTPRRVYYATTRVREDDLQRIDYSNEEATETSLGMSLIGFGTPQLSWSDLSEYSR